MPTRNRNMHWADIMAAIYKAGSTPSEIARAEQVERSLVTAVIRGRRTSHRVAFAISSVTNIPTEKMWHGKYLTTLNYEKARAGHSRGRLPATKAQEIASA